MSDFQTAIEPIAQRYIKELLENKNNSVYADCLGKIVETGVNRVFASRFATKQKKIDFKQKDQPNSILDFIKPTRTTTKVNKVKIFKDVLNSLNGSQKATLMDALKDNKDITDIINDAEWMEGTGTKEI